MSHLCFVSEDFIIRSRNFMSTTSKLLNFDIEVEKSILRVRDPEKLHLNGEIFYLQPSNLEVGISKFEYQYFKRKC